MSAPFRVLLVEGDEGRASWTRGLMAGMVAPPDVERAATFEAGFERMAGRRHDLYLVACRLGARGGIDLLGAYREAGGDGPVVLLADASERAEDLEAMERGAAAYLVRDRLDAPLLERTIRYAVEAWRREGALRRVREELQERVEERTASLETMNAALALEVGERRAAERALRDAARGKDEFLATLAHELRNPLAPLSSAAEILARTRDGPEGAGPRDRALRVIERQVAHMARLIDDLLDLSRVTHGKLELRRERVSLAAVVESALETARPLVAARRQRLELALPETPVFLRADPTRLAQVLSNVLSNATKYTEPGGWIRLEAVRDGDVVAVSIADSGIGIPAAHLEHIFTMFGQGPRAYDAVYGGLGIGLALAKRLVELHGGTLTATSEGPERGSVFTLRLAFLPGAEDPVSAAPVSTAPPSRPRRILVVDDNVEAALTLAELLALEGHETHVAHDGPSAVAAAGRLRPDVAILDLGLPGFDGFETARRLRARPELEGLFLLALSGWVEPADRARSREAGFDHHVAKPVDLRTLGRLLAAEEAACAIA